MPGIDFGGCQPKIEQFNRYCPEGALQLAANR
jgi:hypothetical protein